MLRDGETAELTAVEVCFAPGEPSRMHTRRLSLTSRGVKVCEPLTRPSPSSAEPVYLTNAPDRLRALIADSEAAARWILVDADRLRELCVLWGLPEQDGSPSADRSVPFDGKASQVSNDGFAWRCAQDLERLLDVPVPLRIAAVDCFARVPGMADLRALVEAVTPCEPDAVPSWLDSFPLHSARSGKRDVADPADYRPLDPVDLSKMLDTGGALSHVLTGYEPREGQLRMLEAVVEALNGGRHLMVEAGTGVGKSLAYLLPAILWAEQNRAPVIISTYTRNLQTQLAEKDVPMLTRALQRAPRVALIKGRSNYLCLRRLMFLMEHAASELDPDEVLGLTGALIWSAQSADGDLDDLLGRQPRVGPLLGRLTSNADECPGMACRAYRRCFLQRARGRSLAADVVIANHALVFSELDLDQVALPPYRQIVFDEAHNLEDAATRHFSVDLSAQRLAMWLRRLWRGSRSQPRGALATLARQSREGLLAGGQGKPLRQALRQARQQLDDVRADGELVFDALRQLPGLNGSDALRYGKADVQTPAWDAVRECMARLNETLEGLIQTLEAVCERLDALAAQELPLWRDLAQDPRAALNGLRAFVSDGAFVMLADSPTHVYWVQADGGSASRAALHAAPLDVSEMLATRLYAERRSVICCSATLSVNGSFRFMSERLGLDRIEPDRLATCKVESPFDYGRQVRVLAPLYLPEPNAAGPYEDGLSALLLEVAQRIGGRTMVLFTSYAMLTSCASALARPLHQAGIRLLAQGQGVSRDAITRAFRDGGRSMLFGTHSFWEGVDIMGEALSCVVLARLPFPALGDPLVEARCEYLERDRGRDSFRGYMLPLAVLRFRQGFGRLIRHRTDRGIVIVADRRMMRKSYGVWFRRDLPCPISGFEQTAPMLEAIGAFLTNQSDL